MSAEDLPASRAFIDSILHPHVELAVDLLRMVNSRSTGDPTYRFQIAALTVFLSGVDKALSLAFQLIPTATLLEHTLLTQGFMEVQKAAFPCCLQPQNRDS